MTCQRGTLDVISFLIDAYPDACRRKNLNNDELPLHIACKYYCRNDVIEKLLEVYPDAVRISDKQNRLVLHRLLSSICQSETILFLIQQYPDAVRVQSTDGQLPLHIKCTNQCRYDIIIKLLELYPDAVTIYDTQHRLPLHCALENQHYSSHVDVIYLLIKAYPETFREKGDRGYLPIHLECTNNCCFDVIVNMLELYPDAISITDNNGELPLHCALYSCNSTIEVTSLLISKYLSAVKVKNIKDEYPLHIECRHRFRYDMLALILDIYPDAMIISDTDGITPWGHAIHSSISPIKVNVVRFMITKHPGTAKMSSYVKGRLCYPFHQFFDVYYRYHIKLETTSSAQSKQCKAVTVELLNLYPEALYLPADRPYIDIASLGYPLLRYRMLLNIASHRISLASEKLMHDYHDMNYQPRSCLLQLLYRQSSAQSSANNRSSIIAQSASIATSKIMTQPGKPRKGSTKRSTTAMNGSLHGVLLSMLGAAGSTEDDDMKYGWMKGDDLGCILLRKVVMYL